jgi:DNA-binding PadR family transcriptional regulator
VTNKGGAAGDRTWSGGFRRAGGPVTQRAFACQYDRPTVDLTAGSIRIAVDRLFAKGLVSRVESGEDRRGRIVALTPRGKDLIAPAFRKHAGQMRRVFSELSPEELLSLEALKKMGKRAAALMEQKG